MESAKVDSSASSFQQSIANARTTIANMRESFINTLDPALRELMQGADLAPNEYDSPNIHAIKQVVILLNSLEALCNDIERLRSTGSALVDNRKKIGMVIAGAGLATGGAAYAVAGMAAAAVGVTAGIAGALGYQVGMPMASEINAVRNRMIEIMNQLNAARGVKTDVENLQAFELAQRALALIQSTISSFGAKAKEIISKLETPNISLGDIFAGTAGLLNRLRAIEDAGALTAAKSKSAPKDETPVWQTMHENLVRLEQMVEANMTRLSPDTQARLQKNQAGNRTLHDDDPPQIKATKNLLNLISHTRKLSGILATPQAGLAKMSTIAGVSEEVLRILGAMNDLRTNMGEIAGALKDSLKETLRDLNQVLMRVTLAVDELEIFLGLEEGTLANQFGLDRLHDLYAELLHPASGVGILLPEDTGPPYAVQVEAQRKRMMGEEKQNLDAKKAEIDQHMADLAKLKEHAERAREAMTEQHKAEVKKTLEQSSLKLDEKTKESFQADLTRGPSTKQKLGSMVSRFVPSTLGIMQGMLPTTHEKTKVGSQEVLAKMEESSRKLGELKSSKSLEVRFVLLEARCDSAKRKLDIAKDTGYMLEDEVTKTISEKLGLQPPLEAKGTPPTQPIDLTIREKYLDKIMLRIHKLTDELGAKGISEKEKRIKQGKIDILRDLANYIYHSRGDPHDMERVIKAALEKKELVAGTIKTRTRDMLRDIQKDIVARKEPAVAPTSPKRTAP